MTKVRVVRSPKIEVAKKNVNVLFGNGFLRMGDRLDQCFELVNDASRCHVPEDSALKFVS